MRLRLLLLLHSRAKHYSYLFLALSPLPAARQPPLFNYISWVVITIKLSIEITTMQENI